MDATKTEYQKIGKEIQESGIIEACKNMALSSGNTRTFEGTGHVQREATFNRGRLKVFYATGQSALGGGEIRLSLDDALVLYGVEDSTNRRKADQIYVTAGEQQYRILSLDLST